MTKQQQQQRGSSFSRNALVAAASVAAAMAAGASAWMPPAKTISSHTKNIPNTNHNGQQRLPRPEQSLPLRDRQRLFMAAEETAASPSPMSFLEEDEWKSVEDLHDTATKKAADSDASYQEAAEEIIPTLSNALIMKLRSGEQLVPPEAAGDASNDRLLGIFSEVSKALNTMADRRLDTARDTLKQLMNAGEIKKLDALIGKSARERRLDVAFFQVLQMNLRDASEEAQGEKDGAVDRFQILQHIYTRCQEEVEKTINPGTALLNKLLRTEVDSIRKNQLNHYLCPAKTTITSPDGKEIVLNNGEPSKPLVAHDDFCVAIGNAVQQIRTVEKSGATSPAVAADLVESIRQVAIQGRFVIGEHFGGNSTEVIAFEDALEPVFRPTSPDSPYIQGEQ